MRRARETTDNHSHNGLFFTPRTAVFAGLVLALPFIAHFLGDYIATTLKTFAPTSASTLITNGALQDIVLYGFLTALLFFYLHATLEPLATYGWTLKRDYLGLAIAIGLVSGVVMYGIDIASGYTFTLPPASFLSVLAVLLGGALLPALFEETLFRGVIQTAYESLTRTQNAIGTVPVAVLVASAFEMLFHLMFPLYFGGMGVWTLAQLVYVGVFGGIGGYLYARTGSLLAPLTIHALGNLTEYALVWTLH
jgi:membrane protease YdiL (CAAX protease family)